MKLTIEPSDDFYVVEGVRCRAWSGSDDAGTPVIALIPWIEANTENEAARRRFAAELDNLGPVTALDALLPDLRRRHGR